MQLHVHESERSEAMAWMEEMRSSVGNPGKAPLIEWSCGATRDQYLTGARALHPSCAPLHHPPRSEPVRERPTERIAVPTAQSFEAVLVLIGKMTEPPVRGLTARIESRLLGHLERPCTQHGATLIRHGTKHEGVHAAKRFRTEVRR